MNEQLQKELATWLAQLRDTANAGASFALEQAPLVIQEKVAYGRVSGVVWLLIFMGLVWLAWTLGRKGFAKGCEAAKNSRDPFFMFLGALSYLPVGVSGLLALTQLDSVIKAWIAPRLYVLEWLAGLIK